jgi:hypothetical protein
VKPPPIPTPEEEQELDVYLASVGSSRAELYQRLDETIRYLRQMGHHVLVTYDPHGRPYALRILDA